MWEAPELAAPDSRPAECRLPFCSLWAENPAKMFCRSHDDRWQRRELPRVFRTGNFAVIYAAACISSSSSMTSCGVL
jgi:hypothetical protein